MKTKNIVTIGGGTGSFMLLSGLKKYPINLSAIVSMADDGGSTGVLRDELGVLPPGDVRQCLVALSESSEELRNLMNYRFENGGLKGHNFGNLFLSALEKTSGSFTKGVEEATRILNVKGKVIPVTNQDAKLRMKLKNGKIIEGEDRINNSYDIQKIGIEKFSLFPKAKANPKAIKAIQEADLIVIGPGNHYCSIIPNFLVSGISEAIIKSKAKVVYNCNLINKEKHTEGYFLLDYIHEINGYLGGNRIEFAVFNSKKPSDKLIKMYKSKKELLLELGNVEKNKNYKIIKVDILNKKSVKFKESDAIAASRAFIRHDSEKLAKALMMIMELGDYENIIKYIV